MIPSLCSRRCLVSWRDAKKCPICGDDRFQADCDEVDIGVGVQEFGFRGICASCGEIGRCDSCGAWFSDSKDCGCPKDESLSGVS